MTTTTAAAASTPAISLRSLTDSDLCRRNGSSTAVSVTAEDLESNVDDSTHPQSSRPRSNVSTYSTPTDDFRYRTMATYLESRIRVNGWAPDSSSDPWFGVLLRQSRNHYACVPVNINPVLLAAVQRINVGIAFTMRPQVLSGILDTLTRDQTDLKLSDGSQMQILPSLSSLSPATVKKFQYHCLLRKERTILVWHDDLDQILPHASYLEERLLSLVWGTGALPFSLLSLDPSRPASVFSDATSVQRSSPRPVPGEKQPPLAHNDSQDRLDEDESTESPESLDRPVMLKSAVFIGAGLATGLFLFFGLSLAQIVTDCMMDGSWKRMALLVCAPFLLMVGLFFFLIVFTNIFQLIGPIGTYMTNSRFYSPLRPSLRRAYQNGFTPPHITIQMPVYKEGLETVIKPTVRSLQACIGHYESHGGTASIFINDDGLRLLSEEDAQARRDFYTNNNIGWVARPKHGDDGFLRKGKFKKASNMNFCLNISQKVEALLQRLVEEKYQGHDMIDEEEEEELYQQALQQVLKENPLAQAHGNIRIGEFILIVDSDTRVPPDCLLYGAAEMFLSPEVAIVQHSTGVMQVTRDYFENGITFFTNMVYTAIRFAIGSGEIAPFVGHNAFLRWAAIQAVGRKQDDDYVAYWSESHVSEDFDIALRVQIAGSIVRVASYHGDGFQEGVSLTIYDEITRWKKYAYGCSEMIFHPLYQWPYKGPFAPLIRQFLFSDIQFSSKVCITAYIWSYFAIGSGLPLSLLNYILVGWFPDYIDHFYLPSWKVFVSLIFVFNILGNIALAVLRYRTCEKSLLSSLWENFKWTPMMAIFFSGLSFHVSAALLCHLLHIDMQWGATSKEKTDSNFFEEVPRIVNNFKYMYIVIILLSAMMVYLACFAPRGWIIDDFTAIVPLAVNVACHALTPLVLNPSLMIFNY